MDRLDQPEEVFSAELDRLESILAQKDAELRRLKSEMELRDLYIDELHTTLKAQAGELAALDDRLRRLEQADVAAQPRRGLLPLFGSRKRRTDRRAYCTPARRGETLCRFNRENGLTGFGTGGGVLAASPRWTAMGLETPRGLLLSGPGCGKARLAGKTRISAKPV